MAISRNIDTEWGITVPNSYCRVEAVSLINKEEIKFHVRSYVSTQGVPFFKEEVLSCEYELNGDNPIKQAYLYLKTLPEFSDAEDC